MQSTDGYMFAAIELAHAGYRVFPVHGMEDGKCTCGRMCSSPGKHPRTPQGFKNASSDINLLTTHWEHMWTGLGIATGEGLLVVDIDPKNGGDVAWAELCAEHGEPETVVCTTPSGGLHYYFHVTHKTKNTASLIGPGIDTRGDGGYVVAPPSLGRYTWRGNGLAGGIPSECPQWIVDRLAPKKPERQKKRQAKITAGQRNTQLNRIGYAMRRQGASVNELEKRLAVVNQTEVETPLSEQELQAIVRSLSKVETDSAWSMKLLWTQTKDGDVVLANSEHNAAAILTCDPRWRGRIRFNRFAETIEVHGGLPLADGYVQNENDRALSDVDIIMIRNTLEVDESLRLHSNQAFSAIIAAARAHSYDPIVDYLKPLVWDGKLRLGSWLTDYCGVERNEYTTAVGKFFLVSAVARALAPGSKVDTLLVFEGEQGKRKSTALETLFGKQFFTDSLPDLTNKDVYMVMNGKWCVEIGEFDALSKAESSTCKKFLSASVDKFRPPYGKVAVDVRRRTVFAASTNDATYLRDTTGNRRYWPVRATRCDLEAIKRDRDQLWAEAVVAYQAGQQWWFNDEDPTLELAKQEQEKRVHAPDDPWLSIFVDWVVRQPVDGTSPLGKAHTCAELAADVLSIPKERVDHRVLMRIGAVATKLGWVKKKMRRPGGLVWAYEIPAELAGSQLRLVR